MGVMEGALAGIAVLGFCVALPYAIPVAADRGGDGELPFPESRQQIVGGVRLHYRVWQPVGDDIRGKVLLVHGLGGSTFSWRKNTGALLQAGYLVVAVDLPGFGYSDRRLGVDHSQAARSRLLWQLLDYIDQTLDERVCRVGWLLVGHSMGGGTVAAMAMDCPTYTQGLLLVDGALLPGPPRQGSWLVRIPPVARWLQVLLCYQLLTPRRVGELLASAYGREPAEEDVQGYLQPLMLPGTPRALIDFVLTARNQSLERLRDGHGPIAAIWGEADTWVPVQQVNELRRVVPRLSLMTVTGAGHCPMETECQQFNDLLVGTLEQMARTRAVHSQ